MIFVVIEMYMGGGYFTYELWSEVVDEGTEAWTGGSNHTQA